MSHPRLLSFFRVGGDDGQCRKVAPMEGGWRIAFTAKVLERSCRALCVKASLASLKYAQITRRMPYRIPFRARMLSSSRFSFAIFLITSTGKKVANFPFSLFGRAGQHSMI